MTVFYSVFPRIFLSRPDSLVHYFYPVSIPSHFTHELGNRSCSGIEIKYNRFILCRVRKICILSNFFIQFFGSKTIGLKKRKGCDFKTQAQKFFVKEIFSVENLRALVYHRIRRTVIFRMQNSRKMPFQPAFFFQFQKTFAPSREKRLLGLYTFRIPGSMNERNQDFSCFFRPSKKKVAKIALMSLLVKIRNTLFPKIISAHGKNFSHIRAGESTVIRI